VARSLSMPMTSATASAQPIGGVAPIVVSVDAPDPADGQVGYPRAYLQYAMKRPGVEALLIAIAIGISLQP